MDPLTTLLAAAAATGPNTFQSQALTALRSAGPQESYFTRMGNPHPVQMQQLGQPTAPQLNPIITLAQQIPMPILPLAHPKAEPATTRLHIPTLQAIHRMQQQASPAPTMMPTMPQTPTAQPPATLPRDPAEYTQANFPTLTPRQLAVLAQLEMQDQQALRSSVLQPGHQTGAGGPAPSTGMGHTQPTSTTPRPLGTGQEAQLRFRSEPHTAPRRERQTRRLPSKDRSRSRSRPQHRRHRRSRSHRQDRRSRSHRARRTHRHRPRTPRSRSPSRPSRDQAFILRSRSQLGKLDLQLDEEWMTKWSYRAPPPQHTGPREGFSQSSQPRMETRAPSASFMDLTQEATTASQQPPSRFRPSNYTVDLSNTTNPPPSQVMVKPAVHPFGNGVGVRNRRGNLLRTCRDTPQFGQEGSSN